MMQNIIITCLFLSILIITGAGLWLIFKPQKTISLLQNNEKEAFNLLSHWSHGNVVALIRHTERCKKSNNPCLAGPEGITVPGREMAIELGKNFKALLPLSNTVIYNGPAERFRQTAKFMFSNKSSDQQWLYKGCKTNLYRDIFEHKEEGKNMILITRSSCINRLAESDGNKLINMDIQNDKSNGITIFLVVNKHLKHAYVLGYLYPDQWTKVQSKISEAT